MLHQYELVLIFFYVLKLHILSYVYIKYEEYGNYTVRQSN